MQFDIGKPTLFPDGHFYSPVVDTDEVRRNSERIWPWELTVPGVDMREQLHRDLLVNHFPTLLTDYQYPLQGPSDDELSFYYEENSQFRFMDSRSLFCLMRMIRPSPIVEVGSGYSSLLMFVVNSRFLQGSTSITCIEPFPRSFLTKGAESGRYRLIQDCVQEVDLSVFEQLEDGDILFIDSSHVCKTGSDVSFLFLKILPSLKPGVYVYVHDIFLPDDYPAVWVMEENRSWNEQYILQALLAENPNFEVVFGSNFAVRRFPELVSAATGQEPFGGGSFWFRRRDPQSGTEGLRPLIAE